MENNQSEHSPQPTPPPPPPSSHSASQVVWPPHSQASYEINDAPSSSQYGDDVDVQVQQPVEYGAAESSSGVQDYSPSAYPERYQQAPQDSSSQMMRSLPYDQGTSQGSPFSPQPSTSSSTAYQQVRMHPRHRLMNHHHHHHHHHHHPHHLGNVMGSYDRISPVDDYQNSPAPSSDEHLRQYESMTQLAEQSDQVSSAIRMSQALPSQSHVAISLSSARVDSPSVVDRGPSPMCLDRTSAALQSQRIPSPLTTMANQRINNSLPVPSRYLSSDLVESSMGGHSMSLDSHSQKDLLVEAVARTMVANQLTGSNHVLSMASQRIPSPINMVVSQSQRIPSPTSMDYSGLHGSSMSLGRIQHVGVPQGQRSISPEGSVVQNSQRYSPVHLRSMNASPPLMVSTPLAMQNYVSSSTGPMEGNQSSNMVSSGSVLDSTVDSTVETTDSRLGADEVVESSGASYMAELDAGDGTLDNTQVTGVSTTADDLTVDSAASSSMVSSQNGHLTMSDAIDTTDGIDTTVNTTTLDSSSTVNKMMQLHSMGLRHDAMHPVISMPNSVSQGMIPHHVRIDHLDTIASSRPRRLLHKQRLAEQEQLIRNNSRLLYQTKEFWCEECNMAYDTECTRHRIQMIFDKPVLSRAWASLPGAYLAISKVGMHENGDSVYGVFAKKPIPKRTKFGPVEGVITKLDEVIQEELVLQIEAESGELMHLDTTDEALSNWMRFVRQAENYREQNLVVIQAEQSLYFFSTRQINPRTELKVGYSLQYAERRGLKILEPDEEELKAMEDQENAWPCFECNNRFSNSEDLQKHLNEHDLGDPQVDEDASTAAARKKVRPRGRPPKKSKGRASKKMKVHEDMQVALDTLDEATAEALARRPRGRPPKKFRVALDTLEEATNQALPQPSKRPRGRPPKKFKVSDLEEEDGDPNDRHVRRHKIRGEDHLSRPIKSLFKKKQAEGTEWLCTHCDLTFDNSSLLNLHTLTHAAENVGLEEVARFAVEPEFTIKNGVPEDYKDEFQSELVESPLLKCPQCTQEFISKKDLIEHASAHGKMIMRRSFRGMINPAKPFKCELCYKSFASEERLLRHNLVHGSEDTKPLQCEICFKRFLNNSALACHIKVHSSDEKKYYECPICKEGFDQIILLKDHVHIHCIDGIYTCPSCQKGFEEYNQIRKHIRAFHSEKRYPCEQCDKVFPRPDKLKLHMLRHSDHREFLCANCGKQFKRKDKLKEHMKRMHSAEREARLAMKPLKPSSSKKFIPKVSPTDYHRFIYKCHSCLLGFKRRGMLVNHLAKRHPDIRPESVPELNLPILKTTRDYYCQYCEKVYKSSSKRKAHIIKNHPGAELPMSNRRKVGNGGIPEIPGLPNPTFSQTVGSITTHPHNCDWCHKQYASKAKLLQHQRKKHLELLPQVESGCFEARQSNFFKVEKDVQALERIDRVQYSCSQQIPRTHHRDLTTQYQVQITTTTQTDSDFADTIVIDAPKRKVPTPSPRPPSVYVERDTHTPAIPPHSVENLQAADLLTQAMSELTQTLNEYRSPTSEFHLARVSHSGPPTIVSTSPSTTPVPQSSTPLSSNTPLEQSQLGQILAHYQSQAAQQGTLSPGPPPSPTPSPAPSSYIPRTWTTTFANYPAR